MENILATTSNEWSDLMYSRWHEWSLKNYVMSFCEIIGSKRAITVILKFWPKSAMIGAWFEILKISEFEV